MLSSRNKRVRPHLTALSSIVLYRRRPPVPNDVTLAKEHVEMAVVLKLRGGEQFALVFRNQGATLAHSMITWAILHANG
jgi:hypothetical protein